MSSVRPGSPRSSPRSPQKRKGAFFNQSSGVDFEVGAVVEVLCDSAEDETEESSWLPALVSKILGDSLEVSMLGEGETLEVHESFVRPVAELDGEQVPDSAMVEGFRCYVFYAQASPKL